MYFKLMEQNSTLKDVLYEKDWIDRTADFMDKPEVSKYAALALIPHTVWVGYVTIESVINHDVTTAVIGAGMEIMQLGLMSTFYYSYFKRTLKIEKEQQKGGDPPIGNFSESPVSEFEETLISENKDTAYLPIPA